MSRRRLVWIVLIAVFAAFFFFPSLISLLVDWWWFQEIGYQVVFTRELFTRVLLFLVVGGLTFGMLYLNLRTAQRGLVPDPIVFRIGQSAPRVDLTRALLRMSLPVSLFIGVLAGFAATPAWAMVLRLIYGTPFGIKDPVFSRDIGFYVFTLPGLSAALGFLSALAVISLIMAVPVYALRGDILLGSGGPRQPPRLRIEPSAGLHLATLLAAIFLVTALRLWLVDTPNLLYSTTGPLVGASYTDLHATLPALRVSAVVAVLSALLILISAMRRQLPRYALLAIGGYLAVGFVELVAPPSPAGAQVLTGQPGDRHGQNSADPRGRRRHGRWLQQERDAQADNAAEVDDQRPATTRVQGYEEHQYEGRVTGEGRETSPRVGDQRRGRGQHRDDGQPAVDRDRGSDEPRQNVGGRRRRRLALGQWPGRQVDSHAGPQQARDGRVEHRLADGRPPAANRGTDGQLRTVHTAQGSRRSGRPASAVGRTPEG